MGRDDDLEYTEDNGNSYSWSEQPSLPVDGAEQSKPKKRKRSFKAGLLTGVLIILIPLILLVFCSGYLLMRSGNAIAILPQRTAQMETKLSMIQEVIDTMFLFEYDESKLDSEVYAGYVEALGDPYTCYYTEEEFKQIQESTGGTYYGIGVMISQEVATGKVYVVRVFSGSPAEEAGLKEGDILLEVQDKTVAELDLNEVVAEIKGAEGTAARILIYRESEEKEIELQVERRQVDVDTVYYHMVDSEIGYLELTEFDSVSTEQFTNALEALKKDGMKKLILDLRNNPGGLLDVAVDLADQFIDTGTVVSIEDKYGDSVSYDAKESGSLGIPVAVLVNGDSASASEVLSGCMKDYNAATLIGTQTFGKGIVQNIVPFSDGTAMKLTTAHYYTPGGSDIHGVGITPDIIVEDDPKTEEVDEQLEAAIEFLKK